ncbi:hypothetical protein Cgig2_004846 [Carnegiea gigantea]|uniref:VQ domain-containing protein n=1 Tax=Carnegiea gigantea TaxID=171969 RepID=A0A9Q1QQG3_9CARY|nr:hypothetical protein Cgig2_004846 [Carnegiea gigantea]
MDNHPHELSQGGGRPPRKELQGPRPAPLKVRKDTFKIKKTPVAPPVHHRLPPRQPVIIYTVSPEVIHANPSEFMTVVQRLTGPDPTASTSSSSSSTTSCSSSSFQFPSFSSVGDHSVGISPAARFASIEQTKMPREDMKVSGPSGVMEGEMVEFGGSGGIQGAERTGMSLWCVKLLPGRSRLLGYAWSQPSSIVSARLLCDTLSYVGIQGCPRLWGLLVILEVFEHLNADVLEVGFVEYNIERG